MSEWSLARIEQSRPAADELTLLRLDVTGSRVPLLYERAGQYVSVEHEGTKAVFAIASAPDRNSTGLELLVKRGTALSDWLISLKEGEAVRISEPKGPGFPVKEATGKDVLLFATGSGISSIRALIETIRKERAAFRRVHLYFGARTPGGFAFADQFPIWREEGVETSCTVSRSNPAAWKGLTGYVQHHLPQGELSNSVAFLSGQQEMIDQVRLQLCRRGMPPERIFLNF